MVAGGCFISNMSNMSNAPAENKMRTEKKAPTGPGSPSALQPPRVLPPHYFALSLLLMGAVDFLAPINIVDHWVVWFGVVPIILGVCLAAVAARQFSAVDTNIIPLTRSTTLVQTGVFRYSRNPMYLGMLLVLGGLAWLLSNPWALVIPAAFFCIIRWAFIAREEKLLIDTFADGYLAYQQRVRRWI